MATHSFETSGFESFNFSRRSHSTSELGSGSSSEPPPADDFVAKGWSCSDERRPGQLSPRERQILTLIVDGKTRKEVAYELKIADSTVRVIYSRAMKKLGGRWQPSRRQS